MADNSQDFELWLKSKWDGDPLKAAQADFKRTQKAAQDTEGAMSGMKSTATALKAELMGLLAFAEVVAQFKEGFEQVAALEQAMNELGRQAAANGDDFEVVSKKIVGFADQLKRVAGIDDDAAIKGMTRFYTATKDVEQALAMEALAADIAIARRIDLAAAEEIVSKASVGQTRAIKDLMGGYKETGDAQKDAQAALDILSKTYGGAASKASGYTVELNKMSEKYEDVRNALVERVMPSITWFSRGIETLLISIDSLFSIITESLVRFAGGVGSVMSGAWKALKGDFSGAKEDFKRGAAELGGITTAAADAAVAAAEKIKGVWSGAGGSIDGQEKIKTLKPGGGGTGGGKSRELTQLELDQMALSKFRQEMIEKEKKELEKFEAYKKKLKTDGFAYDKRLLSEMDKERDAELDRAIKRTVDEVRMRKAAEAAKEEAAVASAEAVMGAMGAVFGQSKALASADAAISTWVGAARALKDWPAPYSYIIAAATVAAGLARVAQINSTKPSTEGSGFDNPSNDRAAYIGGRRWAADMIGEFTSGVSAGWASGMGGGGRSGGNVTYDQRSTMNLHMNVAGFLDPSDTQNMAKFARNLAVVNKTVEGQRRTARTAR